MTGNREEMVLSAEGLVKRYRTRGQTLTAVDNIDLHLRRGETLGIVGESGCGKSTLARLLMGLEQPDDGHVEIAGRKMPRGRRRFLESSRHVQMVFQDPYTSLNPRMTVGDIVREPFEIHDKRMSRAQREERVVDLLERVGLNADHRNRYPSEFSGGQRQRVGIARALALEPRVLICDEPVAALDVSVQAQVINLLSDLSRDLGLSYVFIAHDLSIMRQISDRIAVMYLGRIVESGPVDEVFDRPAHPYTRALIDAVPVPDPRQRRGAETLLQGDVPSPLKLPSGCAFRTRCDRAQAVCASERPDLAATGSTNHAAACHFPVDIPVRSGAGASG